MFEHAQSRVASILCRPLKQDFWWVTPAGKGAALNSRTEPGQQEVESVKSSENSHINISVLAAMTDQEIAYSTPSEGSAPDMDALQHLIACNPQLLKALSHIERDGFGRISDRALERIRDALDNNAASEALCGQAQAHLSTSNTGSTSSAADDVPGSGTGASARRASTRLALSVDVSQHMGSQSSSSDGSSQAHGRGELSSKHEIMPREQAAFCQSKTAAESESGPTQCIRAGCGDREQVKQHGHGRSSRKGRQASAPERGVLGPCGSGAEDPAEGDAHGIVRFKEPDGDPAAVVQYAENSVAIRGKQAAQRWHRALKLVKRPPTPGRALKKPMSIFSASDHDQQHTFAGVVSSAGDYRSQQSPQGCQATAVDETYVSFDSAGESLCDNSMIMIARHKFLKHQLAARSCTPGVSLGKPVSIFKSSNEPATDDPPLHPTADGSETSAGEVQQLQDHHQMSSSGKQQKQCRVSFDGDGPAQIMEQAPGAHSSRQARGQHQQSRPTHLNVSPLEMAPEQDLVQGALCVVGKEGMEHKEPNDEQHVPLAACVTKISAAKGSTAVDNSSMLRCALMQQNPDLALDKQLQIDKKQRKAATTPGAGSSGDDSIFKETALEGHQHNPTRQQVPAAPAMPKDHPAGDEAHAILRSLAAAGVVTGTRRSSSIKQALLQLNPDLALEKQQQWEQQQAKVLTTPGAGNSFNLFKDQQLQQPTPNKQEAANAGFPDSTRTKASRSSSMKEALLQLNPDLALEQQQQWERKQSKVPTTPGAGSLNHFSMFKDGIDSNQQQQYHRLPDERSRQSAIAAAATSSRENNRSRTSRSSSLKEALLQLRPELALEKQQQHDRQLAKVPTTPGADVGQHFSIFRHGDRDEQQQQQRGVGVMAQTNGSPTSSGSTAKRSSSLKEALVQLNSALALEQQQQWEQKQAKVPTTPGAAAGSGKPFNIFKDSAGSIPAASNTVAMSPGFIGPVQHTTGAAAGASCSVKYTSGYSQGSPTATGRAQSLDTTTAARQQDNSSGHADDKLNCEHVSQQRRSETSPLRSMTTAADVVQEAELQAIAGRQSPLRHSTTSLDPDPARMSPLGHNRSTSATADSCTSLVASGDYSRQTASPSRLSTRPEAPTGHTCTTSSCVTNMAQSGNMNAGVGGPGRHSPSRLSRRGSSADEQDLQPNRHSSPLSRHSSSIAPGTV